MKPFAIQFSDQASKEACAIIQYCIMEQYPYKFIRDINNIPDGHIPVGSVEYCIKALGSEVVPDYYPEFLSSCFHRKIYKTDEWPIRRRVFIKPADRYKRFTGFVTSGGAKDDHTGPYWCSEVVDFLNEWRYYISNGEVLAAEWYAGEEDKMPDAPKLCVKIPSDYCGAIDFGEISTGQFALVEAQHPFACGWYGKDYKAYAKWIVDGWEYMLKPKG